ncbi:MAG: N-acetylmuramoyl-L-alanine amidase [Acidobacteria bacterium]|jgi:N-acetylmuramoyl-L-alanine amidase|nr:MAG: N-acetylmuramoyl-L-alanine amidase [Acidobacteriota bacterium]
MFPKILVIFSLLIGFAFSQTVAVRFGKYPDKERIVFQFEEKHDYKVFTLENPKRIVVDITARVDVSLPTAVKGRVGKHPWVTRVVLEGDFEYVKAFSLQEPFRIVIDIYRGEGKKRREEDEDLLAIVDPSFIKLLRGMHVEEGGKLINEVMGKTVLTQRRTVVVDAGHGGHDPGAIGFMGVREKDINLAIAQRLAEYLEKDGRFRVIMTRREDVFVPLNQRANMALKNRADLFISIHANASPRGISSHASGTMVFAISSESANRKKQHIIDSDSYAKLVLGTSDIPNSARIVLADLAMDVTLYESLSFGKKVASILSGKLGRDVEFKGIQRAGFAVLKTPGIPSLLIETGFITNPKEALLMSNADFQDRFAKALYESIVQYFFPEMRKVTLTQGVYASEVLP